MPFLGKDSCVRTWKAQSPNQNVEQERQTKNHKKAHYGNTKKSLNNGKVHTLEKKKQGKVGEGTIEQVVLNRPLGGHWPRRGWLGP